MGIIGGVGNYSGVSLTGFRGKQNEQQDEQALVTREVGKTVRTANAESEREFQARQATEEGFARLRVALQNDAADQTETSVGSGQVEKKEKEEDDGKAALDAFKAYMAMTPAEKMRDRILKEMGLTEEDIESMPPEQQKTVEETIAQRMQERAEMQAASDEDNHSYGLV